MKNTQHRTADLRKALKEGKVLKVYWKNADGFDEIILIEDTLYYICSPRHTSLLKYSFYTIETFPLEHIILTFKKAKILSPEKSLIFKLAKHKLSESVLESI